MKKIKDMSGVEKTLGAIAAVVVVLIVFVVVSTALVAIFSPESLEEQTTTETRQLEEQTTTETRQAQTAVKTTTQAKTTNPSDAEPPPVKEREWTGVDAINYDIAKTTCKTFSEAELARQLGTSKQPFDIAKALAAKKRPAFRQAVIAGCLDALLG